MKQVIRKFAADISGATAIEYGIIAAGIFVAIVMVVGEVGTEVQGSFNDTKAGLQ